MLTLTRDNYHSPEANADYMSVHQFSGYLECAARQYAQDHGTFAPELPEAFLIGTYVHAGVLEPETLPAVIEANKDAILNNKGKKYQAFTDADSMIARLRQSPGFAALFTGGVAEAIYTGAIAGVPFKIRMDYHTAQGSIFIDLKTAKDFTPKWDEEARRKLPWYRWYKRQMSVYQAVARQNINADWLPVIVGITKQDPSDLCVIQFRNECMLQQELAFVEQELPRVQAMKSGELPLTFCGACDYCRSTKTLENCIDQAQDAL
jgi:hypothetical protein